MRNTVYEKCENMVDLKSRWRNMRPDCEEFRRIQIRKRRKCGPFISVEIRFVSKWSRRKMNLTGVVDAKLLYIAVGGVRNHIGTKGIRLIARQARHDKLCEPSDFSFANHFLSTRKTQTPSLITLHAVVNANFSCLTSAIFFIKIESSREIWTSLTSESGRAVLFLLQHIFAIF